MSPARSEKTVRALQAAALFSRLDSAAVARLAGRFARASIQAGQILFRADQPAERFYIVFSGRIRVYLANPRGETQILHLVGPGETFAEAAVLSGGTYPAFAEAAEPSEVISVGRSDLIDVIRSDPEVAMGMLAGLSAKLHEFATLIERISLQQVPARLAGALLEIADAAGAERFELPGTKKQLAARLGTVSETLSRALGKLRRLGLINVTGSRITILDRPGLADVAAGL